MPPQIIRDISSTLKLKYAKLGYQFLANHLVALISVPILLILIIQVIHLDPFQIWCFSFLLIFLSSLRNMSKSRTIYLVDFACYKAPAELRASFGTFSKIISKSEPESLEFQHKVSERTGLGEETCLPPALHLIPPNPTLKASREEAERVIFSAMDSLLLKSGLNPKDIDILVVNSTVWCSIPSLSSMVINKYKMKDSVKSFNISGMGCSGSLISMSIVRDLLQVHPNYKAVVISAEIITTSYYQGKERSMLVPNCLFRMGGAAIFLSTRKTFHNIRAKYRLVHLIRSHTTDDDKSYNCVYKKEDPEGILGVWLSKDLMAVAGKGLKLNLTALGSVVGFPASEELVVFELRRCCNSKL
nr:PREDICTED: 3-ketoacyl-CoA synthase 6-like [Daucus carota subsp. sativus]